VRTIERRYLEAVENESKGEADADHHEYYLQLREWYHGDDYDWSYHQVDLEDDGNKSARREGGDIVSAATRHDGGVGQSIVEDQEDDEEQVDDHVEAYEDPLEPVLTAI